LNGVSFKRDYIRIKLNPKIPYYGGCYYILFFFLGLLACYIPYLKKIQGETNVLKEVKKVSINGKKNFLFFLNLI
jgi:hypothetical protein